MSPLVQTLEHLFSLHFCTAVFSLPYWVSHKALLIYFLLHQPGTFYIHVQSTFIFYIIIYMYSNSSQGLETMGRERRGLSLKRNITLWSLVTRMAGLVPIFSFYISFYLFVAYYYIFIINLYIYICIYYSMLIQTFDDSCSTTNITHEKGFLFYVGFMMTSIPPCHDACSL